MLVATVMITSPMSLGLNTLAPTAIDEPHYFVNSTEGNRKTIEVPPGRMLPGVDGEEAVKMRLRSKGETFARLGYLLEHRKEIAAQSEAEALNSEVFFRAENVLDQTKESTDRIRIGISPDGGLELRLRSSSGLNVAVITANSITLERHSGRNHTQLKTGDLPNWEVARFFEENV